MHWFPLYPSDFIGATVGLSCQEVSVYSWMLTLYYELGPFPVERIRTYRIVRCESDEQKRTVDYVLAQFFVLKDDGWYQERAEQERVKQAQFHELAVARGKRSANVRLTKYGTSQPGRIANPETAFESLSKSFRKEPELTTTTTTTTKEEKKKDMSPTAPQNVCEQVWRDWKALRARKRAPVTATAIAGIRRECEKAGITLEAGLALSCERGWTGFKAEWIAGDARNKEIDWDKLIETAKERDNAH